MKRLICIGKRAWLSFRGAWRFVMDNFWDRFFPLGLGVVVVVVLLILLGVVAKRLVVLGTDDPEPMDERVRAFSVRGEAHEYLMDGNQITHLPNCKFCKGEVK